VYDFDKRMGIGCVALAAGENGAAVSAVLQDMVSMADRSLCDFRTVFVDNLLNEEVIHQPLADPVRDPEGSSLHVALCETHFFAAVKRQLQHKKMSVFQC